MAFERLRIDNQVAIVTGAGRGVGRGIALALAEAGAKVVCSARTKSEVDATVKDITSAGGEAVSVLADVLKKAELKALVDETCDRFGRIDILVNNAGGQDYKPFLEITEEDFKFHFDWNTTSAFLLSQFAAPHMLKAGKGAILNISSGAGHIGIRGMLSYCVAKGGLEQLTRGMGQELAPKIRVNCIALGAIMTPALERTFEMDPSFRGKLEDMTPLRAVGRTDDIGMQAVFLCSPAGSFTTCAIIHIDGGIQDTNLPFKLPDL
jgi:NAD(P)-dependent dehydrogenase (short-subunit alcohol dehydrogenase family)